MVLNISKLILNDFNSGKYSILKVLKGRYIKVKEKRLSGAKHHKGKKKERPSCFGKTTVNTKSEEENNNTYLCPILLRSLVAYIKWLYKSKAI